MTVWKKDLGDRSGRERDSVTHGEKTLFRQPFLVGPVPVTVSFGIGYEIAHDIGFLSSPTGVSLSGGPSARVYGFASAALGVDAVLALGLQADINFLRTELTGTMSYSRASGLRGSLKISGAGVGLLLKLYLKLLGQTLYERKLLDARWRRWERTLVGRT